MVTFEQTSKFLVHGNTKGQTLGPRANQTLLDA
jgi:hypothetical protein